MTLNGTAFLTQKHLFATRGPFVAIRVVNSPPLVSVHDSLPHNVVVFPLLLS